MIRRFVNLVVQDYTTSVRSLHRLDVAKHLFYPSTAGAEAASAKNMEKISSNNGGGKKLPRITRSRLLRQLPPLTMYLQRFPAVYDREFPSRPRLPDETFALLGGGLDGSYGSMILHAGEGGQVLLYDADLGSTATLPNLADPPNDNGAGGHMRQPTFISVAGASAGAGEEKGSIYVITVDSAFYGQCHHSFEVLHLSQVPNRWEHLPPPPFLDGSSCRDLKSFMVIDGGRTICVSMENDGTYCFDTRNREWWQAGDWALPFYGRVNYVPELHSWLGSCSEEDTYLPGGDTDYLCASSDLSVVVSSAMDAHGGGAGAAAALPTLQHVWQDVNPDDKEEEERIELKGRLRGVVLRRTKQWLHRARHLINLGGGRFCIAKFFEVQRVVTLHFEEDTQTEAEFVELSGMEVVGGGGNNGGELRMVKHKSKRYMFTNDEIISVL